MEPSGLGRGEEREKVWAQGIQADQDSGRSGFGVWGLGSFWVEDLGFKELGVWIIEGLGFKEFGVWGIEDLGPGCKEFGVGGVDGLGFGASSLGSSDP